MGFFFVFKTSRSSYHQVALEGKGFSPAAGPCGRAQVFTMARCFLPMSPMLGALAQWVALQAPL